MTNDHETSVEQQLTSESTPTSGWVIYAVSIVAVAAGLNAVYGLALLLNDEWVVLRNGEILIFDLTTVGVIHLAFAALLTFTAMGIFNRDLWARVVGIVVASVGIVSQFAFLSIYPAWSMLVILVNLLLVYGLAVHGDEVAEL